MQENTFKNKPNFINLTLDAAFKQYFKEEPILLKSLLKNFLPLSKNCTIESVDLLDSESHPMDLNPLGKNFILDMKVRLRRKEKDSIKEEIINVEMQTTNKKNFTRRVLAYNARLYSNQLKSGQGYGKLNSVYSLIFVTENLKEFAVKELMHEYYHTCSVRRNTAPNLLLSDGMQFIIVELAKFKKGLKKTIDNKDAWCYFLKNSQNMDENACKELSKKGDDMKNAVKRLWNLSQSDWEREFREAAEKQRMDKEAERLYAIEEGEEKGREENKQKTALKMLEEGIDITMICKVTGFSKKQIEDLQKNMGSNDEKER